MRRTLGIMTTIRGGGLDRLLPYVQSALQAGFAEVLLFAPGDVEFKKRRIRGYVYRNKAWAKVIQGFPSLIYDLGRYRDGESYRKAAEVKALSGIPFASDWLGNKWVVHKALRRSLSLSFYTIETMPLIFRGDCEFMLDRFQALMLKPIDGDSGRGIMRISKQDGQVWIDEATGDRFELSGDDLSNLLESLTGEGYIAQRWIDHSDPNKRAVDYRCLIQKNKEGNWTFTGAVARLGGKDRIASNVGNEAGSANALAVLAEQFGSGEGRWLYSRLQRIAIEISAHLERYWDSRFAEFGIDFAIEPSKEIKVLDVNHKPDPVIMKVNDDNDLVENSIRFPMEYAAYRAASNIQVTKKQPAVLQEMLNQASEARIERLLEEGTGYFATPYRYGAVSWSTEAFDSSSFMQYIYARAGMLLPRNSRQQSLLGIEVSKKELRRGDLLVFTTERRRTRKGIKRIGHVGVYCGGDYFLHACKEEGVTISSLTDKRWGKLFIKAKRLITD